MSIYYTFMRKMYQKQTYIKIISTDGLEDPTKWNFTKNDNLIYIINFFYKEKKNQVVLDSKIKKKA